MHVFATFMFYHINFFHVSLKSIQERPNLIPVGSLRNMSVIDKNMLVTRKYRCLGKFYLSTHKVNKVINWEHIKFSYMREIRCF